MFIPLLEILNLYITEQHCILLTYFPITFRRQFSVIQISCVFENKNKITPGKALLIITIVCIFITILSLR